MLTYDLDGFRMVLARFEHGENLNEALANYVQENGIGFAYMPNAGTAQFDSVTLGFYNPTAIKYDFHELSVEPCGNADSYSRIEPTALCANVSWVDEGPNEGPFPHIHGGFASGWLHEGGNFLGGGHVSKAIVGRTCEAVLFVTDNVKIIRKMDPDPRCKVRVWKL